MQEARGAFGAARLGGYLHFRLRRRHLEGRQPDRRRARGARDAAQGGQEDILRDEQLYQVAQGIKGKFTSLGLEVEPEEIFSSSFAAAAYLEQTKFKESGKKVYIVGEVGIQEELDLIGVPYIGGEADADKRVELKSGYALPHDEDVGAVIVGFDRNINYYKIQYAQLCINENPGCQFIVTNLDAVTHLTDAQEWAGNGAMAGAIKGCTGQEPVLVGKPSALMIDYIVEKYACERGKICMVGDRLDTDILFGQNNGLLSCLTLSGVTTEAKLLSEENKVKPDFYVGSIAEFM